MEPGSATWPPDCDDASFGRWCVNFVGITSQIRCLDQQIETWSLKLSAFHCYVIQEILIKATQSLVDRPCCHIFFIVGSHECPLKMEISHVFHDSASIPAMDPLILTELLPEIRWKFFVSAHAYIIIGSCMANLRKRIVACYLNQETLTCFEDVYVPPECATDGWNRDRKRCLGSWSQDWLKMRVMTRQQRNWLILTPPSASSIQIARILAASYHTGQPVKSTDSEIFEVGWSLVEAINGLQTRTHISHIGFIGYR